jgi:hypothetical protein
MGSCFSKHAIVAADNSNEFITPYRDFTQDVVLAAMNRGRMRSFLWKNTYFVICLWSPYTTNVLQSAILDIVTLGGNDVHMRGGCVKRVDFRHVTRYLGAAHNVEHELEYLNGILYEWMVDGENVGYIQFVDMLPAETSRNAITFEDLMERYLYRACMFAGGSGP